MKSPTPDDLSKQVEKIIQAHIAQCRAAAQAAINRAFLDQPVLATTQSKAVLHDETRPTGPGRRRRTTSELQAAAERLYEKVCNSPGATMAAVALDMGLPTRELQRPMAALKKGGRIRGVGQRSQTQYFPLKRDAAGLADG